MNAVDEFVVIGVDPGKAGALGILTLSGDLLDSFDMPTVGGEVSPVLLAALLKPYVGMVEMAAIERVGAMPGNGGSSMFEFGKAVGTVIGVLGAIGAPITEVTPAKWKGAVGLPKITKREGEKAAQAKARGKDESRALAIKTWPMRADLFARKKDDGRAEACLVARWHLIENNRRVAA